MTLNNENPVTSATRMNGEILLEHEFAQARFAVSRLIPEGLSLLCAKPKLGKSWLALHLAVSVATGGKALGEYWCEPGAALYLALEDNLRRMQSRLRTMDAKGLSQLTVETRFKRADEGGVRDIENWITSQEGTARLIIIDTLARFKPRESGKRNSYDADTDALGPLQQLAVGRGLSVLIIHHVRKAGAEDWIDRINGTAGLAGVADALFELDRCRGEHDAVLRGTGRDINEFEIGIRFDPETGLWSKTAESPAELLATEEQQRVLNEVRSKPEGLPLGEIALALGKSVQSTSNIVQRLVDRNLLSKGLGRGAAYRVPSDHQYE
jgi:DNA-binding Lrp family transcriptional regulator